MRIVVGWEERREGGRAKRKEETEVKRLVLKERRGERGRGEEIEEEEEKKEEEGEEGGEGKRRWPREVGEPASSCPLQMTDIARIGSL